MAYRHLSHLLNCQACKDEHPPTHTYTHPYLPTQGDMDSAHWNLLKFWPTNVT